MSSRRSPVLFAVLASVLLSAVWATVAAADPPQDPTIAVTTRGDRYKTEPPGTISKYTFWFGPYVVPAGSDLNRPDIELPLSNGFIISAEPAMRYASDLTRPTHQEGHIHHAHWFALDPGNTEDNYTYGNTEWIFGNGDEETKADFTERSAADPKGPIYGEFIGTSAPQLMIYMLHNKTPNPMLVYVTLDITFLHGTAETAGAALKRPIHDVTGVLFGRTYTVPRNRNAGGTFNTTTDSPKGPITWTSTVDGTMVGTGSHLHQGGLEVVTENLGSKENPCPNTGDGFGGTKLLSSKALFRHNILYSEDFQMEVSHPAWRAPIHKGDRIRITGIYENKDHGWYDVMTHQGIYIDEHQAPQGRCKPYLAGGLKEQTVRWKKVKRKKVVRVKIRAKSRNKGQATRYKRVVKTIVVRKKVVTGVKVTDGVPNRPFHPHEDTLCGVLKYPACDRPETKRPPGKETSNVTIANFLYTPGDLTLSGEDGAPPRVKKGTSLTFTNVDQFALIRHSVTTCPWPCNGRYVSNYPFPDGVWDSGTLGYDPIDGGSPNPSASTPTNLKVGKYAYFCRIHPWMRGAFEVVD